MAEPIDKDSGGQRRAGHDHQVVHDQGAAEHLLGLVEHLQNQLGDA
jgi:hypothetical protein